MLASGRVSGEWLCERLCRPRVATVPVNVHDVHNRRLERDGTATMSLWRWHSAMPSHRQGLRRRLAALPVETIRREAFSRL